MAESPGPRRPPTLQEIMDEALAMRLHEEECRGLVEETLPMDIVERHLDEGGRSSSSRDDAMNAVIEMTTNEAEDDGDDEEDDSDHGMIMHAFHSGTVKTTADHHLLPVNADSAGFNSIRESFRRWDKDARHGRVGKTSFSTRNDVMDPRTTLLLQKLINRGDLDKVHGCVQSGKEANVYFAEGTDEKTWRRQLFAVKIFRSTLNAFSNRGDYVTGDRRFDFAFHKKDSRRQLQEWTEKEYRNLCRASRCIRTPAPLTFKEHIVVMAFVGTDGVPAPTLKEVKLTTKQLLFAYVDVLDAVRSLFHDAMLVHSDLSEYNVLYHQQRCWLIDFGQAVDQTHPEFLSLLRRDLHNIREFFLRRGLPQATQDEAGVLSEELAFRYVTHSDSLTADDESTLRLLYGYRP